MSGCHKRPYCFIDFDGTLVDNKLRMYRFCCDYCCEEFSSVLTMDEYWGLKRFGVDELSVVDGVLGTTHDSNRYAEAKLLHMEDEAYLELDELVEGSEEALNLLGREYKLVLVTRREHPRRLMREVDRLGVRVYFENVIVIPHDNTSKSDAIRQRFEFSKESVIVGDTEDDLAASIELGITGVFVLSGIRSAAWRLRYNQGTIIQVFDSLFDFAMCVCNRAQ